jgi:hypothetical protein
MSDPTYQEVFKLVADTAKFRADIEKAFDDLKQLTTGSAKQLSNVFSGGDVKSAISKFRMELGAVTQAANEARNAVKRFNDEAKKPYLYQNRGANGQFSGGSTLVVPQAYADNMDRITRAMINQANRDADDAAKAAAKLSAGKQALMRSRLSRDGDMSGLGRVNTIVVGATSPVDVQRREQQLREIAAKREAQFQKEYRAEADRLAKERADSATARMRERAGRSSYLGQYSAQAAAESAQAAAAQRAGTLARFGTSNVGMPAYLGNANTLGRVNTIGYGATSQIDLQRQRQRLGELRASQAAEAARAAQANWPRNLRIGAGLATMTGNYQIAGGLYAGANMAQSAGGMGGLGTALGGVSTSAIAAAAAIGGVALALGGLAMAGREINKRLAVMNSMLPSGSDKRMVGELQGSAMATAIGSGKTTEEILGGYRAGLSANINPSELPGFVEAANNLVRAAGGEGNLEDAIKAMARMKEVYGDSMGSMTHVTDVLASSIRDGIITVDDISTHLSRAASEAKGAGVGFEDLATSFQTLSRFLPSTRAATTIEGLVKNIRYMTPEVRNLLGDRGVFIDAATVKAEGFLNVVRKMIDAAKGNPDLMRLLFPDTEGRRGLEAAIVSLDKYNESLVKVKTEAGTAAEMIAKAEGTFGANLGKMVGAIWEPLKNAGSDILNTLNELFFGGGALSTDTLSNVAIGITYIANAFTIIGDSANMVLGVVKDVAQALTNLIFDVYTGITKLAGFVSKAVPNSMTPAWLKDFQDYADKNKFYGFSGVGDNTAAAGARFMDNQKAVADRIAALKAAAEESKLKEKEKQDAKIDKALGDFYNPGAKSAGGLALGQRARYGIRKAVGWLGGSDMLEGYDLANFGKGGQSDDFNKWKEGFDKRMAAKADAIAKATQREAAERTRAIDEKLRAEEIAMNREVNTAIKLKDKLLDIETKKNKSLEDAKAKHDAIMNSNKDAAEDNKQKERAKNPARGWREATAEMDLMKEDIRAAAKRGDQDTVAQLQGDLISKYNSAAGMADAAGDGAAFAPNRNYGYGTYIESFMGEVNENAFTTAKKSINSKSAIEKAQVNSAIATVSPAAMALIERATEKMKVDVKNEVNTEITANVDIDFQSIKVRVQEMMKEEFAKRADALMKGRDKVDSPNKNTPSTSSATAVVTSSTDFGSSTSEISAGTSYQSQSF